MDTPQSEKKLTPNADLTTLNGKDSGNERKSIKVPVTPITNPDMLATVTTELRPENLLNRTRIIPDQARICGINFNIIAIICLSFDSRAYIRSSRTSTPSSR
jgi:hypothetical protein